MESDKYLNKVVRHIYKQLKMQNFSSSRNNHSWILPLMLLHLWLIHFPSVYHLSAVCLLTWIIPCWCSKIRILWGFVWLVWVALCLCYLLFQTISYLMLFPWSSCLSPEDWFSLKNIYMIYTCKTYIYILGKQILICLHNHQQVFESLANPRALIAQLPLGCF